jgi:fermentation-respiration switch protein FrsA (DUF1100 family)
MRRYAIFLGCLFATLGCTRIFLQPSTQLFYKPEKFGIAYEAVEFPSSDGTKLTGLFFPSSGTARGTVVHFHGNAQNMTTHFFFSQWLTGYGFNVLAFDYRGYGASGGRKSIRGSIRDGQAALRYIQTRSDVDGERVFVFAQSMGGAIAIPAIAKMTAPRVKAIAVEASFSSYSRVARDKMRQIWVTWPLQWPLSGLFLTWNNPARYLNRLPKVPLVFIHGDADVVVPFAESQRLFALAQEPKEFWQVIGGGHTEAFVTQRAKYRPKLAEFFANALKR